MRGASRLARPTDHARPTTLRPNRLAATGAVNSSIPVSPGCAISVRLSPIRCGRHRHASQLRLSEVSGVRNSSLPTVTLAPPSMRIGSSAPRIYARLHLPTTTKTNTSYRSNSTSHLHAPAKPKPWRMLEVYDGAPASAASIFAPIQRRASPPANSIFQACREKMDTASPGASPSHKLHRHTGHLAVTLQKGFLLKAADLNGLSDPYKKKTPCIWAWILPSLAFTQAFRFYPLFCDRSVCAPFSRNGQLLSSAIKNYV